MTRETLADVLDEIALLLELKNENPFKVRAYRQGAETVRSFDGDIVQLAADNQLDGIKGIGEALRDKLHLLASTGSLLYHQHLRAEFPPGLFDLYELQGLGPKKIKALYDALKIDSIAALKTACTAGQVASLPGFGEKTQHKILEAIALHEKFADAFTLAAITPVVGEMLDTLRLHPEVSQLAVAGSYRRAKETVHDLDFLVATQAPALVCEDFTTLPQVASVIACGGTKASVRLHNGLQCDLRAVSNSQFPFALQYFTGSKEHNVALRSLALKQGLSLNEYGLTAVAGTDPGTPLPAIHEEADLYHALGLDYIQPELRENRGEIEAAADHTLPLLVELPNLRGTFHNHTPASDGLHTLEAMAAEAIAMGLGYLGIADHSKSTYQANGLDETRLLAQVAEIRRLNATWDDFRLFAGSEVDILKDGSLDFDDSILSQLDYSVASVHQFFNLTEDEMTRRICRAMENPHVTMLGHLTGRLLLKREPYPVNHALVLDDPAAIVRLIHETTTTAKAAGQAPDSSIFDTWLGLMPASLLTAAAALYSRLGLGRPHPPLFHPIHANLTGPPMPPMAPPRLN